jgi:AcrR family transcriptional regulator
VSQGEKPSIGLRERKKAKTRAAIQHHALRLFREQGYDATTVEQIAEAAEVSESTLYRYFPTKEDLVLWDEFDPLLIEAFRVQPPDLTPLEALRRSFHAVFDSLTEEDWAVQRERLELEMSVPEVRAAMASQVVEMIRTVADLVAERVGRPANDLSIRTWAGAVIGVAMSWLLTAEEDPTADWVSGIDATLAHLEAGLPL